MSHFAETGETPNEDGWLPVLRVLVVDSAFVASGALGDPARWVETSYTGATRTRFAARGGWYDPAGDAFIDPRPFPSWQLDPATLAWQAPVLEPDDGGAYVWDEGAQEWVVAPGA